MITVFTPTYNRAHLLRRLYGSLCEQTVLKSGLSHPFEWVVVDDGSTDNTEELMQTIFAEQKISVNYIKKTNGGKHTAIKGLGKQKVICFGFWIVMIHCLSML